MAAFDPASTFHRIEGALEVKLAARGYAKTKHDYHPDPFGNRYTVFTSRSGHIRFTWDGKLRWFILRVYKKRSRFMNTILMSFMGKYDLDKLLRETVVKSHELALTDDELILKFTEGLEF